MKQACSTHDTETANPPVETHCPPWCRSDHEAGAYACQTARRTVVRVPVAGPDTSSVHAFRLPGSREPRVTIGGEFYTVEAALEYAAKIEATCAEVTPPSGRSALAELISVARNTWGMSQRDLAKMCGISRSHLGSIERDEFSPDLALSGHIARTILRSPFVRRSTAERAAQEAEFQGFQDGRVFERLNGPAYPGQRLRMV